MSKLRVVIRPDTGALTIVGTVAGQRIRQRAETDSLKLAKEQAATLETAILREQWHGPKLGSRPFAEAVEFYIRSEPRSWRIQHDLQRIILGMRALGCGDAPCSAMNKEMLIKLESRIFLDEDGQLRDVKPATKTRRIITPVRAVLHCVSREGWCAPPRFKEPREAEGKTEYLLPHEARRVMDEAAPHQRELLLFYFGCGARHSEALTLDWADVDLEGATATFWGTYTKGRKTRRAHLPPAVVEALRAMPNRAERGAVFLAPGGRPYSTYLTRDLPRSQRKHDSGGGAEGGITNAFKRAGFGDRGWTVHTLRHTWASWYYVTHDRDLLDLKREGGWSNLEMVERYAHTSRGHEQAIEDFWHGRDTGVVVPLHKSLVA